MDSLDRFRVPLEKLRKICECSEELASCGSSGDTPSYEGVIGQDRAVESMHFGLSMDVPGYNIFVVGQHGTGRSTYTQTILQQAAMKRPAPKDWCYVNNFLDKDRPVAVSLPAGQGKSFQKDMDILIEELKSSMPKAFEQGAYEQKRDAIVRNLQETMEKLYGSVEEEAVREGFTMKQVPPRFVFIPVKDGVPMPQDQYEKLTSQERAVLDEKGRRLMKRLDESMRQGQELERQAREEMTELERQVAMSAAAQRVGILKAKYADVPKIVEYLFMVLKDVVDNYNLFRAGEAPKAPEAPQAMQGFKEESDPFVKYKVNLFVNNERCKGAPVIIESNPNYYNLFGKLEYMSHMLSVSTDFTMLRAGAIHKANGGYLVVQAKDILTDPYVWEALKKALKYRQTAVENIGEQYRLIPAGSLRPEPLPLDLKIVVISNPQLYYLLYTLDDDFQRLFKVKVDFDVDMPRTPANICQYADFVSATCSKDELLPFGRDAVAKVIEYGSRLAGNQNKLSTRFNEVTEIIYEAASFAKADKVTEVRAAHVDTAVRHKKYRAGILEEKIQEHILKGKMLIRTEGKEVGQINGLSVISTGGNMFGMPSRITARTYSGRGGIINIERETQMSGQIHTKGVLTLSGYLGGKFAQKKPLGFTAQITFEQSYEGVDGDSASSTELYAILSSLSGIPLRQDIAVTGSVDQRGKVQPIGGATEKIEGFFDICASRGLTGTQGVMIPVQNIDDLMLKDEVIDAVKNGKFTIYAVKEIDEGIEVLTGMPAGELKEDGTYPDGTVFHAAERRLHEFTKALEPPHIPGMKNDMRRRNRR